MNSQPSTLDISTLVQADQVHKRVYTDPQIFDLEMERIWGHAWIFIGHESQVPKTGDYFATTLGTQPVIMIRNADKDIKVLYNRCPHKGALLLDKGCGHAEKIRCPYHGYVFDSGGKLAHIPRAEGYDGSEFGTGKSIGNVTEVPYVDSYRGFIFASLNEVGQDLESWLGVAATTIDNAVDRSPEGEIEILGGCQRYLHDANWKVLLENITDNLHAPVTHQSAYQPARQMAEQFKGQDLPLPLEVLIPFGESYDFFDRVTMTTFGKGHSYSGGDLSIHTDYKVDAAYLHNLEVAHGKERARKILSMSRQNTIIYPSIAVKSAVQILRIYRPIAVNQTLQETWTYRLKGAPDALFEDTLDYNQLIFSPTSIAGHDDYEAYHLIQEGLQSDGGDWVSQHRYLGQDRINGDDTSTCPGTSDSVFRHEFAAWLSYMTDTNTDNTSTADIGKRA